MKILDKRVVRSIQSQQLKRAFVALKSYIRSNNYYWTDVNQIVDYSLTGPDLRVVYAPNTTNSQLLFTTASVMTDRLIAAHLSSKQIVKWLRGYLNKHQLIIDKE